MRVPRLPGVQPGPQPRAHPPPDVHLPHCAGQAEVGGAAITFYLITIDHLFPARVWSDRHDVLRAGGPGAPQAGGGPRNAAGARNAATAV